MFHMAGSNKAEYAPIAARLSSEGFATLAIDQRSGGAAFGKRNETVAGLGRSTDYLATLPDLEAALAFAQGKSGGKPVIVAGSSYSAALVFPLAQRKPESVAAVLAFSPGEYLSGVRVRAAAAGVLAPIYVTSASDSSEIAAAKAILAAAPGSSNMQFAPARGVHGASTLRADANPGGQAENWRALEAFLDRFKP